MIGTQKLTTAPTKKIRVKLPTPKQMADFANTFSKEEWVTVSKSQEFLDAFAFDLSGCRLLAMKALGRNK